MTKRWIATAVLFVYAGLLINVVVFKNLTVRVGHLIFKLGPGRPGPANFLPLKTILPELRGQPSGFIALANLAGNTLLFVPVGFLAGILFRRIRWPIAIALGVGVGLTMETLEVIFRVGRFDVDDILLNALGVMIGFAVWRVDNDGLRRRVTLPAAREFTSVTIDERR